MTAVKVSGKDDVVLRLGVSSEGVRVVRQWMETSVGGAWRTRPPLATTRSAGKEGKGLAVEPNAARLLHGALNRADADAVIVVAAGRSDKARPASEGNQGVQLRQPATSVNQIAAEQQ